MSYFQFNRERTIASTLGHTLHFPPKTPTYVPPEMERLVYDQGGDPVEVGDVKAFEEPEDTGAAEVVEPNIGTEERRAAIHAAFERIMNGNTRGDWTAHSMPHTKAMFRELGWPLPAAERDEMWAEYSQMEDDKSDTGARKDGSVSIKPLPRDGDEVTNGSTDPD